MEEFITWDDGRPSWRKTKPELLDFFRFGGILWILTLSAGGTGQTQTILKSWMLPYLHSNHSVVLLDDDY